MFELSFSLKLDHYRLIDKVDYLRVSLRWSPYFWLFFLGLLFILWTWLGYRNRTVDFCWGTKKAQYCFGWGGWGEIGFCINKHAFYTGLEGSPALGFHSFFETLEQEDNPSLFAPALSLDKDRFGFSVASWLILLAYIISSIALSFFWTLYRNTPPSK